MALQVWLPLNEDLENKGLNMMTFSNSGPSTIVIDNNGKIGKCYKRSSIQTAGRIISNSTINLNGNLSMFCWAKVIACVGDTANGLVSNHSHANNTGFGITVKQVSSSDFRISCNTGNGSNRTYMSYYGTSNIKDKWCHLGLTYDNTKHEFKLWVNGICEKTVTYTNSSRDDYIIVFDWSTTYNSNSYKPACFINDVRIYDHCLSPKEVKEISKGLVLHYKLDNCPVTNLNPYILSTSNYSQSNYANRTTSNITNGIYHVNGYQNSSSIDTSFLATTINYITLQANTDYYLSFYCKSETDNDMFFGTSGQAHTSLLSNNNVRYYPVSQVTLGKKYQGFVVLKIHTGSETQYKISLGFDQPNIYGIGSYIEFSQVMLSLQQPTEYIPYGFDNKIYDSSGYQNNGTIIGNLQINNNTPRYNYCNIFNGSSCINVGQSVKVKDEISVCCWAYMSNWSNYTSMRLISCTESGGWTFYCPSSAITFYIGTGVSSNTYKYAGNMNVSSLASGWHYFVGTYNGLEIKLYIDGVLNATTTAYSTKIPIYYYPNNGIFVGAEAGSNITTPAGNYFNGYLSDVRIYCTALLDSDILALYNNPANIDNQGNMFSFEFDEEEVNKQQILQNGITKIDNFIEINDKIKVLSDGSVFLQILHHNNPASNLFTVSNCWLNNAENLYSALVLLKTIFKNLNEYEFLACEKAESSTTSETQFRWKQTSNPALSSTITGKTIISGSVTYNQGLKTNGSYAAMHNGSTWWCACGSYTAFSGGIPGFNSVIKSGYLDLYIRIPEDVLNGTIVDNLKFFKKSILSNQIIEK